jgi:plasmid maintenance system antidote protein VapI
MSFNKSNRIPFPHPGETIREDFLKPLSMSVNKLALELRVPASRMTRCATRLHGLSRGSAWPCSKNCTAAASVRLWCSR